MKLPASIFAILPLVFLLGCSSGGPDIKGGFAAELPDVWRMKDFRITVSEEVGTKVSPVSQHRFIAKVSPREDLHERAAILLDRDILKRVHKKGTDVEIHGVAAAVFSAGKWETLYQLENSPFYAGQPAKAFRPNHVVIGSSEYRSLIKSARTDLETSQSESGRLAGDLQKKMKELQTASVESQERIRQSNELIMRAQKDSQEHNSDLYRTYTEKTREINIRYAADLNESRNALNGSYSTEKATLDSRHTANITQIRNDRTDISQWRQAELRRVTEEYNGAINQARQQRLDAATITAVRNTADAKAKNDRATIEEETRKRMESSRERENTALVDYRAEVARMQEKTKSATDSLTGDINGQRDAELSKAKQEYDTALEATSSELKDARSAHNSLVQGINERQRQLSSEINGLRNQMNAHNQSILNLQQVLSHLESQQD